MSSATTAPPCSTPAAIFFIKKNGNETMAQLHDTGGAGDVRFGSSEYLLEGYYRQ
jgi:hypothetical protein